MEPLWEYRWLYHDLYYGPVDTNFWMTDSEAKTWHGYSKEGSMRIEETRRDRNLQLTRAEFSGHQFGIGRGPDNEQPLPEFVSPMLDVMRRWWFSPNTVEDGDIRRLVLEVIALRRTLRKAGVKAHDESAWVKVTLAEAAKPPGRQRMRKRR